MTALATDLDTDYIDHLMSRIKNGTWLDQQVFPPLKWAVPGLIPEGFGLLVGPPKLGKSWFALGLCLSLAYGAKALGKVPLNGARHTLYCALEDGERRLQDRARKLTGGEALPDNFDFITQATPEEILTLIEGWLDQHPDGVVVLDTLGRVMPSSMPGESAYQRDYRIGARLKALTDRRPGSSLVVVHHVRKQGSGDWMDATSGTNGLNGAADWTIALERARGENDALIKVTGRDVREDEYAATITDGFWAIQGDTLADASAIAKEERATVGVGDTQAQIVKLVNANPEGVTAADVASALVVDPHKARTYLSRACSAGRIQRSGRGLYTSVASVASVALDGDSPPNATHATQATPPPDLRSVTIDEEW